jgi:hypothetical protein
MNQCSQKGCKNKGKYAFTWPGHDESFCCEEHKDTVINIAKEQGFFIELIPIE